MSWFQRADGHEPWQKLISSQRAGTAAGEDSHEVIHTRADRDSPNDVSGLLISFSYCDAEDQITTRTVHCYRCWHDGDVTYVQGKCMLRDAVRTFRTDRMANLKEVKSGRRIADPTTYFEHFADAPRPQGPRPPEPATHRDIEQRALLWHRRHQARRACIDGLRVIAYTTLCGKGWSESDRNIEESYIEARLAMAGFERNAKLTNTMVEIGAGLAVPFSSFLTAATHVAQEQKHFELVRDCVTEIVDLDNWAAAEAEAYHRLMAAGAAQGYR